MSSRAIAGVRVPSGLHAQMDHTRFRGSWHRVSGLGHNGSQSLNNKPSTINQLPLRWFDTELRVVLGIDVFSSDFPKSKGYQIFHRESADVLLPKLESVRVCSSEAFSAFLNVSELRLLAANVPRQKRYYPAYKSFIDLVDLPADVVSNTYD